MPDDNDEVEALRIRYDEVLARNQAAKTRLAKLLDESSNSSHHGSDAKDVTGNDELSNFNLQLDVLRSQKEYQRRRIIIDHLHQAEELAKQHGIFSVPKHRSSSTFQDITTEKRISELQQNLNELLERSKNLTSNLEERLYQARLGLKQDQVLLDQVRAEHDRTGCPAVTPQGRLRGLQAAKADLTTWIEDILARCEEPESELPAVNDTIATEAHAPNISEAEFETALDALQDRYIAARTDIQAYSAALQDPLPDSVSDLDTMPAAHSHAHPPTNVQGQSAKRHPPQIPAHNSERQSQTLSLNAFENTILPERTLQHTLQSHLAHLHAQLSSHNASLSASLHRLSTESHLLPSYPVLAHDERFAQARRVFGTKHNTSTKPDSEKGGETDEERAIERLLGAWGFAVESAEERNFESVRKIVEEGERALGRAAEEGRVMGILRGKVAELDISL